MRARTVEAALLQGAASDDAFAHRSRILAQQLRPLVERADSPQYWRPDFLDDAIAGRWRWTGTSPLTKFREQMRARELEAILGAFEMCGEGGARIRPSDRAGLRRRMLFHFALRSHGLDPADIPTDFFALVLTEDVSIEATAHVIGLPREIGALLVALTAGVRVSRAVQEALAAVLLRILRAPDAPVCPAVAFVKVVSGREPPPCDRPQLLALVTCVQTSAPPRPGLVAECVTCHRLTRGGHIKGTSVPDTPRGVSPTPSPHCLPGRAGFGTTCPDKGRKCPTRTSQHPFRRRLSRGA